MTASKDSSIEQAEDSFQRRSRRMPEVGALGLRDY